MNVFLWKGGLVVPGRGIGMGSNFIMVSINESLGRWGGVSTGQNTIRRYR